MHLYKSNIGIAGAVLAQLSKPEKFKFLNETSVFLLDSKLYFHSWEEDDGTRWYGTENIVDAQRFHAFLRGYQIALGFDADGNRHV